MIPCQRQLRRGSRSHSTPNTTTPTPAIAQYEYSPNAIPKMTQYAAKSVRLLLVQLLRPAFALLEPRCIHSISRASHGFTSLDTIPHASTRAV